MDGESVVKTESLRQRHPCSIRCAGDCGDQMSRASALSPETGRIAETRCVRPTSPSMHTCLATGHSRAARVHLRAGCGSPGPSRRWSQRPDRPVNEVVGGRLQALSIQVEPGDAAHDAPNVHVERRDGRSECGRRDGACRVRDRYPAAPRALGSPRQYPSVMLWIETSRCLAKCQRAPVCSPTLYHAARLSCVG